MKANLEKLKSRVKKLNMTLKVFTGLSFGLLSLSVASGITAFSLKLNDNLKNKEEYLKNRDFQVENPITDGFKYGFYATTYAFIGLSGSTIFVNHEKEKSLEKIKNLKSNSEKMLENQG